MRVLIVEDEVRLAEALGQIMSEQKYAVDVVYTGTDGLDYALSGLYDVIVLDVMLPGRSGFDIVRELRAHKLSTPVLMLTARDETADKVTGLDCGADDYMTKPFVPDELLARVRALSRRQGEVVLEEMRYGDLTLHLSTYTLQCGAKSIHLGFKEYEVLRILMVSPHTVVPKEELLTINQGGTHLPSHCDHNLTPGIDMTTGSLGQGSSLAVGVAMGKRISGKDNTTYLILGDGEIQEGQVWEAASLAAQQKLSNLIAFVDWNKKQLDGYIWDINDFSNIAERFAAFGWDAVTVDGHDVAAIADAIENAKRLDDGRPHCIVLDTIKGKGCSFVSDADSNHHVTISAEQLAAGLAELEEELAKAVAE